MHDRRLEGRELRFGNQGALFMNAMVWYDHQTDSIWSQPWGAAIAGPMKGESLTLIPYDLAPFSSWRASHPDTKVLVDERGRQYLAQGVTDSFVVGVAIQDAAVGYYFKAAAEKGVVNHEVGQFPVAVFVDEETRKIHAYLRNGLGEPADDDVEVPETLSFAREAGRIVDQETGSEWDVERGIATAGPLRGAALQQVPYTSSYDWAWEDFYPHTAFWEGD